MRKLISQCWDEDPEKRPTFEIIYNELKKDLTCFGTEVNEEEINSYIDMIELIEEEREEKPNNFFYSAKETKETEKLREELNKIKIQLKSYDELQSKNHHNYVLIEKMKNLLIEKGNLDQNEQKLGGIDMVKTAFAKKDKIINDLKKTYTASNDYFIQALHYLYGNKRERNDHESISYLKFASSKGNSYASYILGLHYANDEGEDQNFDRATFYFKLTSEQGNSSGFNGIGLCYNCGYGVEQNYSKAKEYYEKSSKLGNSHALNNLGNLYENGYGVEQNYSKSKEYYEESSKLGNSDATSFLDEHF